MLTLVRARAFVLLYHRVAALAEDPQLLAVHPERFDAQLTALARHAELVPLSAVREPATGLRVAITFDDGYADNLTTALPILRDHGVPATVFVTSRAKGFWWDRLEQLLLHGDGLGAILEVTIDGRQLWLDARGPAGRARAYDALHPRLRELDVTGIHAALASVERQLPGGMPGASPGATLDRDQLRELAADELIEIGAHTRRHPKLTAVPPGRQAEEIAGSKRDLESATGGPVTRFAYPYGNADAVDRHVADVVRRAGFDEAYVNMPGAVPRRRRSYTLPRHLVRDWTGKQLEAELRAWSTVR